MIIKGLLELLNDLVVLASLDPDLLPMDRYLRPLAPNQIGDQRLQPRDRSPPLRPDTLYAADRIEDVVGHADRICHSVHSRIHYPYWGADVEHSGGGSGKYTRKHRCHRDHQENREGNADE